MKKIDLMVSVGKLFGVEPTVRNIADGLNITTQTVRIWPDDCLSRIQLSKVVGDITRKGMKVPTDIVKALKESK